MFKYFNSQFYGKHHRKNKYISLGGIEQPSVDVTYDCLHSHPENIADHVETHDKGHARRNYKNCCKVMLLFFIFSILPSVDASGGHPLLYLLGKGGGWVCFLVF